MIKALSSVAPDGRQTLILGLSDENWHRLRHDDQPIPVTLSDLDPGLPPITVLIVAGPTEESMYEDLRARVPIRDVHRPTPSPRQAP